MLSVLTKIRATLGLAAPISFLSLCLLLASSFAHAESLAAILLYHPGYAEDLNRSTGIPPAGMTTFRLQSNGPNPIEIEGWQKFDPKVSRPIVIFFYGNATNMESLKDSRIYEFLDRSHIDFLFFDYPGYGLSKGRKTEGTLVRAGELVINHVQSLAPNRPIVLWGDSLGSAVAIQLAAQSLKTGRPICQLILMAPWTSLTDMAKVRFHLGPLAKALTVHQRYDSISAAEKIRDSGKIDVLVIHGDRDRTIPFEMGEKLYRALGSDHAQWLPVHGADHNDLMDLTAPVDQAIARFLNRADHSLRGPAKARP